MIRNEFENCYSINYANLPSGREWASDEDGLEIARQVVSESTGIVVRVVDKVHDWDDAFTYSAGSQTADSTQLLGAPSNMFNGGGAPSEVGTFLAAVGESLERYSAAYIPVERLWSASAKELATAGANPIDPDDVNLFHNRQFEDPGFPFSPFTWETKVSWTQGWDMTDGCSIWVPSELIYLAPPEGAHPKVSIGYATSSGLAFHATPAEAILNGIYELVERDGFTQAWYGSLALPHIDRSQSWHLDKFLARHVDPSGVDIDLLDMSMFTGIPSVLGISRNIRTDLAPVAFGAAASSTLVDAACSAAVESLQTRNWVKAEQRDGRSLDPATCDFTRDIQSFDDHIRLFSSRSAANATEFLSVSQEVTDIAAVRNFTGKEPNTEIRSLIEHLAAQGIRVFAFDLTSPDVAEAGGAVFKVFSPDLHPLDSGYRRRFLGGERLRRAAMNAGIGDQPIEFDQFNPWPHPFP